MYLSRIELDLRRKETQLKLLRSPQVVHAAVENCFNRPEGASKPRTLWRIDELRNKKYLLLLSEDRPEFTEFAKQFCSEGVFGETKDYTVLLDTISEDNQYSFKLVGNPTKKVDGKIIALPTLDEQIEWLIRKAEQSGFKVDISTLRVSPSEWTEFARGEHKVEINKITYEGILEVVDIDRFIGALTQGIGRAKAYGCGLLTLVPRRV